jgi:NMD protein affecting ribosome stability and mRNA decay
MKSRGLNVVDRGRQRALDHRGVKSDHSPPVAFGQAYAEGTICQHCGAVYARKTWRRADERAAMAIASNAERKACPACLQVRDARAYGRILLRGRWVKEHEGDVRRRIASVEARAGHTQPMRRVVEIGQDENGLEILSTSQKLAHRMVRELEKAFGGSSTYRWSDRDGSLTATWAHD